MLEGAEGGTPPRDGGGGPPPGAYDLVELVEGHEEHVVSSAQHTLLHESLRFRKQRLLVDEVAAHHAVLGILAVADEGAKSVDRAPGLLGSLGSAGQCPQALQQ